jgi:hypothetical protein
MFEYLLFSMPVEYACWNWFVFCLLLCFELELDNASSFFIKCVVLGSHNIP